ncbi:MAG: hypothetical protein QXO40_05125 [Candidatus Aenigmatarchaeota archaeon]
MEEKEYLNAEDRWNLYEAYLRARKEFKIVIQEEKENKDNVIITVVADGNKVLEVKTKNENEDEILEQIYEAVFEDETVLKRIEKKFLQYFPHKEIQHSYIYEDDAFFIIHASDKRGTKKYVVELVKDQYANDEEYVISYKINFKKEDFEEAWF